MKTSCKRWSGLEPEGGPSASQLLKKMDTDDSSGVSDEDWFKAHLEKDEGPDDDPGWIHGLR
jgi:hypothetical protein